MSDDTGPRTLREWVEWFRTTDEGAVVWVREVVTSAGAVLAVGLLLFAISGVWPPMVAVESSSMHPNMNTGDLVFVMEEHRLSPEFATAETGVVTYQTGEREGYTKFSAPGDVIIYRPDNRSGTPIIHRARFWVDDGENWYDRANRSYVGSADNCNELRYCPAPHAGFITKGDNENTNRRYDQVNGLSPPVRPGWVVGTAEVGIPLVGYVKLCASSGPCPLTATAAPGAPPATVDPAPAFEASARPANATAVAG
ncbi:S26 family signal peptidase [Halorarius halobius]|uniref:S26 family signal peptidase n=1 Tax=Halorarius halobius TaxID=2962671 RepID=UPI0020CF16CC|nr:S26 family signal peptidase [Halorarius halobius]